MREWKMDRARVCRYMTGILGLLFLCIWSVQVSWASGNGMEDAAAKDQRVYDMAGLFTEEEAAGFESTIAEYRKAMSMDVVVVTTEDSEGKTARAYADDFFDEGGFGYGRGRHGVLFLIDMDNRELWISTSGDVIRLLTDARIENILDGAYEGASSGAYGDCVDSFLQDIAYYHKKGVESGQYNFDSETGQISIYRSIRWYEALLALAVSAGVAASVCLGVIRQYGMKKERGRAANYLMAYRADCQFQYQNQQDNLINKFVSSRIIPRNNTGSGGSGGGGRSSSGRSTTHRSSSGRSHGGGGRKF